MIDVRTLSSLWLPRAGWWSQAKRGDYWETIRGPGIRRLQLKQTEQSNGEVGSVRVDGVARPRGSSRLSQGRGDDVSSKGRISIGKIN